jgi:hypothetical protein
MGVVSARAPRSAGAAATPCGDGRTCSSRARVGHSRSPLPPALRLAHVITAAANGRRQAQRRGRRRRAAQKGQVHGAWRAGGRAALARADAPHGAPRVAALAARRCRTGRRACSCPRTPTRTASRATSCRIFSRRHGAAQPSRGPAPRCSSGSRRPRRAHAAPQPLTRCHGAAAARRARQVWDELCPLPEGAAAPAAAAGSGVDALIAAEVVCDTRASSAPAPGG